MNPPPWTTTPLSPKYQPGQVVFIRAKVVGNTEHGIAVEPCDRFGKGDTRHYVRDEQILTQADVIKAVSRR